MPSKAGASTPSGSTTSTLSVLSATTSQSRFAYYGTITHEGGAPAPDATIEIVAMRFDGRSRFDNMDVVAATSVTAEGRYEIGTDEKSPQALRVRAPGCGEVMSMAARPDNEAGGRFQIDVELRNSAEISGRVVDDADRPVPGELVMGLPDNSASSRPKNNVFTSPGVLSTTTSADGTFAFKNASPTEYRIGVQSDKYAPSSQNVTAPAKDVLIKLESGGASLAGSVVMLASNAAVASATVELNAFGADGPRLFRAISSTTDQLGNFRLERIPAGTYRLMARKDRLRIFGPAPPVTLASKETSSGLIVTLYGGHTVRGTVTDHESEKPVAGVEVSCGYGKEKRSTYSDAGGNYRLEGFFGGQLQVVKKGYRLFSPDRYSGPDTNISLSPGKLELEKNFSLVPAVTVNGVVRRAKGDLLAGVKIRKYQFGGYDSQSDQNLVTDAKGAYEFEVRPYSTLAMEAKLDGFPSAFAEGIQVEDKSLTAPDIILKPGGTVSGTVVTPQGGPAPDASVSITKSVSMLNGSMGVEVASGTSGADGTFSIALVTEGTLRVGAHKKGFADSKSQEFGLQAKEAKDGLVVKLETGHFISGKVTKSSQKPVRNANVWVNREGGGSSASVRTDGEGKYRVEDIAAGIYSISVSAMEGNSRKDNIKVDSENVDFVLGDKSDAESPGKGTFIGTVVDWKTRLAVKDFNVELRNNSGATVEKDRLTPGSFIVKGLRPHYGFGLHITASGYMDLDDDGSIQSESKSETKEFVMGPGGTISGRAVESGGARPVANVRVQFYGVTNEYSLMDRSPLKVVTTGTDGTFSFERVAAGDNQIIFRPPSPLNAVLKTAAVKQGEVTDLGDVEMGGGGTITGKVLREPGDQPVPDVKITVVSQRLHGVTACVSAADGSFRAEDLSAGYYNIQAPSLNANASVDLKDKETRDVVLKVGSGVLKGLVTKGGQPAVEAYVNLSQPNNGINKGQSVNGDGTYRIEGLAPGTWKVGLSARVSMSGGGYTMRSIDGGTVEINSDEVEKNLTVPAASISGRVVDGSGQPKGDVSVVMRPPKSMQNYYMTSMITKADGSFMFDCVDAGDYQLTANCGEDGYAAARLTVVQDTPVQDVVLKVQKGSGGTLVSTALNMDGQPVDKAWCYLDGQDGRFEHSAQRDAHGVMTIQNIPPGTYAVEVSYWSYSSNKSTVEIKAGETARTDAVLYAAGALRWKFTNAAGAPLPGIYCTLTPDAPDSIEKPRSGNCDASGEWVVRGLAAGPYTGTATTPSGKVLTEKITITTGQTAAVTSKE